MAKRTSSQRWLREHFSDPYVKKAQETGLRSRAAFKLIELQARDRLFKPGMIVIDLGAAPGGWAQVVWDYVKPHGKVIALDLLPIEPLEGVVFIQGDFSDAKTEADLEAALSINFTQHDTKQVDWVISDMAPNMSGNESIDVPRSIYLADLALEFSLKVLKEDGGLLIKVFQGEGFDPLLAAIKGYFQKVVIRKPKASRGRSREVYVLARGRKVK